MKLTQSNTTAAAAAKTSISLATAYQLESDPRLPSQKKAERGCSCPGGATEVDLISGAADL